MSLPLMAYECHIQAHCCLIMHLRIAYANICAAMSLLNTQQMAAFFDLLSSLSWMP